MTRDEYEKKVLGMHYAAKAKAIGDEIADKLVIYPDDNLFGLVNGLQSCDVTDPDTAMHVYDELKAERNLEFNEKKVKLQVQTYEANNAIYLGLVSVDEEEETVCDITVGFGDNLPPFVGYVDINNGGSDIVSFVEEEGLGIYTGRFINRNMCRYPLYYFNQEKLSNLDPEGVKLYMKAVFGAGENKKESAEKLYLYKQYCDKDAFGEEITKLFRSKDDALAFLRENVESNYGISFNEVPDKIGLTDGDTFDEDYVSIFDGDAVSYWIVEEKEIN